MQPQNSEQRGMVLQARAPYCTRPWGVHPETSAVETAPGAQ